MNSASERERESRLPEEASPARWSPLPSLSVRRPEQSDYVNERYQRKNHDRSINIQEENHQVSRIPQRAAITHHGFTKLREIWETPKERTKGREREVWEFWFSKTQNEVEKKNVGSGGRSKRLWIYIDHGKCIEAWERDGFCRSARDGIIVIYQKSGGVSIALRLVVITERKGIVE